MKPKALVLTRADCLGCRDVALNLRAQGWEVKELPTEFGAGQLLLADVMAGMSYAGLPVEVEFPVRIQFGTTEAGT